MAIRVQQLGAARAMFLADSKAEAHSWEVEPLCSLKPAGGGLFAPPVLPAQQSRLPAVMGRLGWNDVACDLHPPIACKQALKVLTLSQKCRREVASAVAQTVVVKAMCTQD